MIGFSIGSALLFQTGNLLTLTQHDYVFFVQPKQAPCFINAPSVTWMSMESGVLCDHGDCEIGRVSMIGVMRLVDQSRHFVGLLTIVNRQCSMRAEDMRIERLTLPTSFHRHLEGFISLYNHDRCSNMPNSLLYTKGRKRSGPL